MLKPEYKWIFIISCVLAIVILVVRVKYFPYAKPDVSQEERFLSRVSEEWRSVSEEARSSFQGIRSVIGLMRSAGLRQDETEVTSDFFEDMERRITEKMNEKKLSEIPDDLKNIFSQLPDGWNGMFRINSNDAPSMIARINFQREASCEECIGDGCFTLRPIVELGIYGKEDDREFPDTGSEEGEKYRPFLCSREELLETERYFVVDLCANDFRCGSGRELIEYLNAFFSKKE